MSRLRSLTVTIVAVLSACGAPERREPPPAPAVEPGAARPELVSDAAGTRLLVRVRDASGADTAVAELVGAWLDTGNGARWLDVAEWITEPDRIVARCESPADHEVLISVRDLEGGRVGVQVEDRIGVRVSLAGLGVAWRLIDGEDPDEVAVPLLHPDPDGLAGDAAFRAPIAFVRSGTRSLAVLPDLRALSEWRRIPQALRVERGEGGTRVLHAIATQRTDLSLHSARVRRAAAEGIRVRDEVVRLEHVLEVATDARRGRTLTALQAAVWREHVSPALQRSSAPLVTESWAQLVPAAVHARIEADLRTERRGDETLAFLADPDASTEDMTVVQLGARRNMLRDALAALRLGDRTGDPALRETAVRVARFALLAPRREGLTPHSCRIHTPDGRIDWSPGDPEGPRPDAFDAADAATTAVLLLELAESIEEIRPAVRAAAADLARFLVDSQRSDGAIPGVHEPRYLTPVVLEADALAGATAGPAWFLTRFALEVDDPEVLEAARRAVRYVATWIENAGGPVADPSLRRARLWDPVSGAPVRDLVPLTLATRAAAALAERDPTFAAAAGACADALAELQQIWTPPWMFARLSGGFGGSNADATWNAEGQAAAAQAMLDAFRLLGRSDLLERGAAALRCALVEPAPFLPDGSPRPDPRPFAAAAAAVAERCRAELGQAVLGVDTDLALGIDAVWFDEVERAGDRVWFRTLTHAPDVGPVVVGLRAVPREMPRIVHAATEILPVAADRVTVEPRLVPALTFRPPAIVPAPGEWWPEAAYAGPAPAAGTVHVEVFEKGQLLDRIPLRDAGTGRLVAEKSLQMVVPIDGESLQARLVYDDGTRRETVPPFDLVDLSVGPMACIDPGDDLESTLVESTPGTSVVRFVDGRENARQATAGSSFTYVVPVPADAAAVELRVLARGALAISSGPEDRTVHVDQNVVAPGDRSIALRLADQRLWPDGELELRFRPVGASMSVARIEYLATGTTERADVGPMHDVVAPFARIDLLVLPLGVGGSRAPDPELLRQALVGGVEYRLTPAPEARPTSGSLARWVTEVSGGRTQVTAEILAPFDCGISAAELVEPGSWGRILESVGPRLVESMQARPVPFDAFLLVHSGGPIAAPSDRDVGGTPVVVLPAREPDGSFLSCGRIARELLVRLTGLTPLGLEENGAFGALALTGRPGSHAPPTPAGINLVRTGWAGIVEVGPQDHERSVRLPPLLEGRTVLRATSGGLPGAGVLHLETRRDSATTTAAGLLVYRMFEPGEEPILSTLDGRTVRPHVWRLSPAVATLRTPFEPATRRDLFRDTLRLDDLGPPSLATPRGDTPWTIDRIEMVGGTTADLRFHWHGTDLLASAQRGWATGVGDVLGPVPEGGTAREPGRVVPTDDGPVLELGNRAGARLRGVFELPERRGSHRLFVRFDEIADGAAHVQVATVPGETLAQARLTEATCTVVADLPPGASDRIVLTVSRIDGTPTARLTGLSLVARAATAVGVTLPDVPAGTVRLMDGTFHGSARTLKLDERGTARVRVPILTPSTRGVLRLVCGTAWGDPHAATLRVELRDAAGGAPRPILDAVEVRGEPGDEVPLVVALCELPELGERQLSFLDLVVRGTPGGALHLVTTEIDRL